MHAHGRKGFLTGISCVPERNKTKSKFRVWYMRIAKVLDMLRLVNRAQLSGKQLLYSEFAAQIPLQKEHKTRPITAIHEHLPKLPRGQGLLSTTLKKVDAS